MKKRYVIFLLVLICMFSIGCSTKYTVEALDVPIEDNMELESTKENEAEGKNVEVSTYTVENGNLDSFLYDYEKNLNDKGWETTNNLKPNGLVVEKNNKKITIVAYEKEGKLMVDVIPTPEEKK